jgi:DDE superfamily endonuclease
VRMTRAIHRSAWMKVPNSFSRTNGRACPCTRVSLSGLITPLKQQECVSFSWPVNRWPTSDSSKPTPRRTSQDWAHFIRELVDVHYPQAEKLVLVMDDLHTHTPSSLYSTFAPPEALRILKQLELHYTPVHGSWLNMAEIELSALARQCLSRRMGTQGELEREVQAWQQRRNEETITVNWRFTTADARIKLKRLYPSLEPRKRPSKKINVAKKA